MTPPSRRASFRTLCNIVASRKAACCTRFALLAADEPPLRPSPYGHVETLFTAPLQLSLLLDVRDELADVSVETAEQLLDEAENARTDESVSIIWIPDGVEINPSGNDLHIEQFTVASNRSEGTTGGRIISNDEGQQSPTWSGGTNEQGLISIGDNGRLTGVVVRGPHYQEQDSEIFPGYRESHPDHLRRCMERSPIYISRLPLPAHL